MPNETISGLPIALEKILMEAAHDEAFQHTLLGGDRLTAVEQRGHQLSESERAVLEAVPQDQLVAVLDQLAQLPEAPPQAPVFVSHGIRPEVSAAGIRSDGSPVRGLRPGKLLLGAAVTAAAVGAAAAGTCLFMAPTGSRPDLPPAVEKAAAKTVDAGAPVDGKGPDTEEE